MSASGTVAFSPRQARFCENNLGRSPSTAPTRGEISGTVSTRQSPSESPRLLLLLRGPPSTPRCRVAGTTTLTGGLTLGLRHFTDPNNSELVKCQEQKIRGERLQEARGNLLQQSTTRRR